MAHWYTVYHNEDYEAEIQVGLYDQWLQQVGSGPTQADRVLVYTDMMEHAHERRFAVCQAGIDMVYFEGDHSRRVKHALDHLQSRFTAHTSREVSETEDPPDEALIGLIEFPSQPVPNDCSQFATHLYDRPSTMVQDDLNSMLSEAQQRTKKRAHSPARDDFAEYTDDEDYVHLQVQVFEEIKAARKKVRASSATGALQMKPIRRRRKASSITKDGGKRHCYLDRPTASPT